MHSNRLWIGLSIMLAVVSAFLAWRLRGCDADAADYIASRAYILVQQGRTAPEGMTLVVADSIVEQAYHRDLCGAPVFNAGISSAGLRHLAPLATDLSGILKPSRIILAIGTNDAAAGRRVPTADWIRDYEALLAALPVERIELVAIPPVEPGKPGSGAIDLADLADKNRELQSLAARRRIPFAPSAPLPTRDGIHVDADGAAAWRENVERHCPP